MPGTPVKLLWSREEDMQHGSYHPVTQCKMVGAFDKDNNLTGLHMRISGQSILATVLPSRLQGRQGPGHVPGPRPRGRDGVRLHGAEPPDRPRHAQPARPGGLLARRQRQPQRHLRRMLHGRACSFDRRQRAGVPAQADEQEPEEPGGAQRRGREDRLGQARGERPFPRLVADDGVRQLRGRRTSAMLVPACAVYAPRARVIAPPPVGRAARRPAWW